MADALRILDVVITGLADGNEGLGVLDISQVEDEVFGPVHLADELDVVPGQEVAAVELVPEHAVKIGGGLVHQAEGEGVLVINACGQKAVLPHLRGPGDAHDAQLVLDLIEHLFGLGSARRDDHFVGCDDEVGGVLLGRGHESGREVRVEVVVAVHKLHILAAGQLQAQVAGVRYARVFLVHQHDAGVFGAELFADGQALVLGTVVQDDDLDVGIGLCADAAHAAGQMVLGVVHGQDDADKGLIHGGVSFSDFIVTILPCGAKCKRPEGRAGGRN